MTPMMQQYLAVKEDYKDSILMYRLGDFYEMFFEDAKIVSRELELTLTGRDCGEEERAPMCGVPYHAAENYIGRLVAKGYKVVVCEQTEDPSQAKGLVRREVTRIVTPGTVIESNMLDESKNNYLASVFVSDKNCGLAFVDVSTGEVHLDCATNNDLSEYIINRLGCYTPTEVIINKYASSIKSVSDFIKNRLSVDYQIVSEKDYDFNNLKNEIGLHISDNADLSKFESNDSLVYAFGSALLYLKGVQKNNLENINDVDFYNENSFLTLDICARRNLELTETQLRHEKKGSLLWVLDHTKTAMGKRLMRNWVEQPLINYSSIILRQNAVEELTTDTILLDSLMEYLSEMFDVERIMTRIVYGTANAKELKTLSQTIKQLVNIKGALSDIKSKMLVSVYDDID
ncbi:MAG: DNA mismatch repair protein MutS, partial [Ruminiclostridium sp.]|nr:DNA mismatch repair protein MutS [Ruminiclostridium sp.]